MSSPLFDDNPTILAVDDQATNLLSLEVVLQHQFNLIPAHSGAEAIAILQQRQDIDVVLMDVHMPVMDGFETAAQIKKMAPCQEIPIIFITA
ncbi:MAG: response regulator, partial [Betaproteobacteria bacterium]